MILAIDMGNTNITVGGIEDDKIYFLERITTNKIATELEYAISIKNILEIHGIKCERVCGAIMSSVVPPLNSIIKKAIKKISGVECILVKNNIDLGMKIKMDEPEKVGCDMIVDCIAAINEYNLPLAVVDMGTATTISIIDKNKNYIGGIIHPGITVSLNSLSNNTAQLPYIELDKPCDLIGTNTINCMKNGILYGHASIIDGYVERVEKELGEKINIIATGGLASFVVPLCEKNVILDEYLMLKGLNIIYEKYNK